MRQLAIFLLFLAFSFAQLSAQNGCDGQRYRADVFSAVKKTTVEYATTKNYFGGTMSLMADVYEPAGDAATARPVVVLAHGGSFITGDRTMMASYCEQLAKKGYIAATIQYRLYPVLVFGFPDSLKIMDACFKAVSDMKAAIRYFRQDAAGANLFHADTTNIFCGGYSAGAVAALHGTFVNADDDLPLFIKNIIANNGGYTGDSGNADNQAHSSDVKMVLNMSGGLYRAFWLDGDDVPIVSIHGTADGTVPYISGLAAGLAYLEGSGLVHPVAKNVGVENYLETVTGGDHVSMYSSNSPFAPNVASFITHATDMMEAIICGASSGSEDVLTGALAADWSVFPNPVSGAFQILLPENLNTATVLIFNSLGQEIARRENYQTGVSVPTDGLGKGVFSVKIADAARPDVQFLMKKIVVE